MTAPTPYRRHLDIAAALAASRAGHPALSYHVVNSWAGSSVAVRKARARQAFAHQPIEDPQLEALVVGTMFEGEAEPQPVDLPRIFEPVTIAEFTLYLCFCAGKPFDPFAVEAMRVMHEKQGTTEYVRTSETGSGTGAAETVVADTAIFAENIDVICAMAGPSNFVPLFHVMERFMDANDSEMTFAVVPVAITLIDDPEVAQLIDSAMLRGYKARMYFALASATTNLERVYVDPVTKEELTGGDVQLRAMEYAYGVNTEQLRRPRPTFARPTRREVVVRLAIIASIVAGVYGFTKRFTSS